MKEMEENGIDPTTKGGKFTLEETKTKPISLTDKGLLTAKNKGNCYIYWSTPNKHGKLTRRYRFDFDVKVYDYTINNKTLTLTYAGQTANGSDAIFCNVDPTEWKSANTKVATIGQTSGKITAISKGSSKITATWKTDLGKVSASFTLKVNTPVLNKTEVTIPTGSKFTLTVKNVPKESYFYWELGDANGTIDPAAKGTSVVLTALKPGENTYTAWVDEVAYTCNITVPEPRAKKSPINLAEKKSASISITDTKYKATAFEWRSTNPGVATVTNKGKVTANKRGYATIIASVGDDISVSVPVIVAGSNKNDMTIPVKDTKGIGKSPVSADATSDTVIGNSSDGMTLTVEKGTFSKDTQIEAKPLDQKQLKKLGAYKSGVFEEIIDPVDIVCEGYEGGDAFGTNVTLTINVGQLTEEELAAYVFAYYDEDAKTVRYLYPDSYDVNTGNISIELPHFSKWWGGKITKEEQIDAFLNTYSTQMAVKQGKYEKAAAQMEPYIRKKAEALGLRREAAEDLIQSTINFIGNKVGSKYSDGGQKMLGAQIELGTKTATSIARAVADNDMDAAVNGYEDVVCGAMQKAWESLDYSNRPGAVFAPEVIDGAVGSTIGNATNLYKMVKNLNDGKPEEAKQDLSNILQSIHPAAELATKGTKFVAACVNVEFTYWKANKVEELYQVYKNGGKYSSPGNKEEFLEYLNYSSGLCWSKGINRFYQMDKMEEIWQELRLRDSKWEKYNSYYDLPEAERNRVQKMAEDGLMEYFEIRLKQEGEAAKIKAKEQLIVATMMTKYTGALDPSNTDVREFFGEQSEADYNITARLERMVNVRAFISQYVDEDKLNKYSSSEDFNYGDFMNEWVNIASKNRLWENPGNKEASISEFCQYLKKNKYLKDGFNLLYEGLEFDNSSIGYAYIELQSPITFRVHPVFFAAEDDWNVYTINSRQELPINEEGRTEMKVTKPYTAALDTAGHFSVSNGPLTMTGNFNAKMRTGSGTFKYKTSSSQNYYSAADLQSYIRETGSMDNFLGEDFQFIAQCMTNCDTSTEIEGTFKISPSKYNTNGVNIILTGNGKIDYSGAYISYVNDYNSIVTKNPNAELTVSPISGTKTFEWTGSYPATLIPKKVTGQ